MRAMRYLLWVLAVSCMLGCGPVPKAVDKHAGHNHGSESTPHGGHILELTGDAYHAEWTHDDDGKITVYILDKEAKADVPIAAKELVIDTEVDGSEPKQFKLAAINTNAEEKCAQFELTDKGLAAVLQVAGEGAKAVLTVKIEGKDYTADIEHEH